MLNVKKHLKFYIIFSTIVCGVDYSLTKLKSIIIDAVKANKKSIKSVGGINHGSKSSD